MSAIWSWIKENVSKKLVITVVMFLLTPYLQKLHAVGITDDMIKTLLQAGMTYVGVQGLVDAVKAHADGKIGVAQAAQSNDSSNSDSSVNTVGA